LLAAGGAAVKVALNIVDGVDGVDTLASREARAQRTHPPSAQPGGALDETPNYW